MVSENGLSSVDTKDMAGDSPLHWAVMLGNVKTVEFLLAKEGVNIDSQNYHKNTPLMLACTNGNIQIIELLL